MSIATGRGFNPVSILNYYQGIKARDEDYER